MVKGSAGRYMKKILFNGSIFVTKRKDGIPRFAEELLKEFDVISKDLDAELVTPVEIAFPLKNIKINLFRPEFFAKNHLCAEIWRQILFVNYANSLDCIVVDLGMMLPFGRNDICAIYDCLPEMYPNNYKRSLIYNLGYRIRMLQRRNAILHSKLIVADSEDAKKQIIHYYHPDPDKIHVIYGAWQHFLPVKEDYGIFETYPQLKKNRFFFSLGSRFLHKNNAWIISAARQNPNDLFVVTGYNDVSSYSKGIMEQSPENVLFTGYLSDGEIKALMASCRAFIQPSFTEGFGMPPMEALSAGAEIIVSDASCLPEIYQEAAHYIDPYDYDNIDMDAILAKPAGDGKSLLKQYSWKKSAERLLDCIRLLDKK